MAAFDWRHYIKIQETVDPASGETKPFTLAERLKIERSLDSIAGAFDKEGENLIMQAAQRAGGQLVIKPGEKTKFAAGAIIINPDTATEVMSADFLSASNTSQVGDLAHELYHAATLNDPEVRRKSVSDAVSSVLPRALGEKVTPLVAKYSDLYLVELAGGDNKTTDYTKRHLPDGLSTAEKTQVIKALTSKPFQDALVAQGIAERSPSGYLRPAGDEKAATEFTDAFMAKNFGAQEPQRGIYANGAEVSVPSAVNPNPIQLPFPAISQGFTADTHNSTPSVSPPSVSPVRGNPELESLISGVKLCSPLTCNNHATDAPFTGNQVSGEGVARPAREQGAAPAH